MEVTIIETIRTNNFTDSLMAEKIQKLWQESLSKITEESPEIVGIYHNYESNYRGDYDLSIAIPRVRNSPCMLIDEEQKYQIFPVDTTLAQGVFLKWQEIWALEAAGKLNRSYKVDFEKYQSNQEIAIYIGIK